MTVDGIFEHVIKCSGELSLHSTCVSRPPTAQACVGVDYGWPDNRINLYSWYQRCTFTFGLKWGPRNRWEPFSTSWELPSSQLKPIYDTCGSIRDPLRSFPTATPPPLTNVSHVLVPNPTPLPVPSTPLLPVPISTPYHAQALSLNPPQPLLHLLLTMIAMALSTVALMTANIALTMAIALNEFSLQSTKKCKACNK